jgi:hypothetical protein
MFELYYTYGGTDYKVFPLDVTEGIGWKNIQGFPCNSIALVSPLPDSETTPGRYRITYDETNVNTYRGSIEACTLAYDNRSAAQRACYVGVRTSNPILVTCENAPETTFTYDDEIDNLEGNSNTGIIPDLAISFNEFPLWPNIFDIFYGGFFIEAEERYLIPLDFGTMMRGDTGAAKTFTIKAVGALNNCTMQIIDKGASPGSFVWNMKLVNTWYHGEMVVDIGDFDNNDELEIELRCYPFTGITETLVEGYLQLTADEGTLLVPLRVDFVSPETIMDGEVVSDGELFFRCVVLAAANANKLEEFGITEAS